MWFKIEIFKQKKVYLLNIRFTMSSTIYKFLWYFEYYIMEHKFKDIHSHWEVEKLIVVMKNDREIK